MFVCALFVFTFGLGVVGGDPIVLNTTMAATNIESTIGTPAFLVDPTLISSQNTTDSHYEVSFFFEFFYCSFCDTLRVMHVGNNKKKICVQQLFKRIK